MANERRLISADEIEKLFYAQIEHGATDLMDAFDDALQDCWPVDAVEVCYCKDCRWRGSENCAMFYRCDCGEQHTWETDNDYCSYGEKREVE